MSSKARKFRVSPSAHKALDIRRRRILDWVDSIEISIPVFPYRDLVMDACQHYNQLQRSRGRNFTIASINKSQAGFLHNIVHNYLRHECSAYDDLLDVTHNRADHPEIYDTLKAKITKEINNAYPFLGKFLNGDRRTEPGNNWTRYVA